MANDPKAAKAAQLNAANAAAAAAGGGAAGGGVVQKCKWDLYVKVHSQERFWPKQSFNVKVCNLTPAGDLGAAAFAQKITMTSKISPEVHYCNSGTKNYGVTAMVSELTNEKDWKLAAGTTSKAPLVRNYESVTMHDGDTGSHAKHVNLYISHPLEIHLQLKFKDPENRILHFPENFPVQVYAGKSPGKKLLDLKTTADGKLDFEMDRTYNWFTLKFGDGNVLVSNGNGATDRCELKKWAEKQTLVDAKDKFFSPPNQWALIESDWDFSAKPKYVDNKDSYKQNEGKIYIFDPPTKNWVRRIGETGTPVVLTLDPHWQFLRFEYFDRYFGHTTTADAGHNDLRVNTPTVFVEGYWSADGKNRKREGGGFWTLKANDRDKSVHALPWIRQKDSAGAAKQRPDSKALIMFQTKPNTYSVSSDKSTRKIEVLNLPKEKARLDPSADRLKLYDLPQVWKSANYFARYKDAAGKYPGKFFEQWDTPGILKSRDSAKPMIFSLDDVVLTNSGGNTLTFLAADLFAVFYHRFLPAYNEAANVSKIGIYKPAFATEPVDSGPLKGSDFNYLIDYPNWVRLVAGRSSLFDVFDQRTKGAVIGARAGIRYYNPAVSGAGPGSTAPAAGLISKRYFTMRPYYQATYPDFQAQFLPEPTSPTEKDGRFDMVLLRCCDHDGNKELFVNMSYFRFIFTFLANSITAAGAAQTAYGQTSALNLMKRWNGNDAAGANNTRAELRPQDAAKNLWGECIFFVQPVSKNKEAHFNINVQQMGPNGRQSMDSFWGNGQMDDADSSPTGFNGDALGFTFAHEFGHAASLPDEYGEWWFNCSDNSPGVQCNTPGDPFVEEGSSGGDYFEPPPAVNHVPPTSGWSIMEENVQPRNRHFWHNAEFARKFVDQVPFLVKHGAFVKYKVPGHPNFPNRTYTYWPIKALVSKALGKHGKFDIILHATGEDKYTKTLLPSLMKTGGTVDGILSLLHRIRLKMPNTFVAAKNPAVPLPAGAPAFLANVNSTQLRDAIRNAMVGLTGKFYAKGTAKVKTDKGVIDLPLSKALVRFSPRFLIHPKNFNPRDAADTPAKYTSDFNNLMSTFGTHYNVNVVQSGKKAPTSGFNTKYGLDLVVDLTKPIGVATAAVSSLTKQYYIEMLGTNFDPASPNLKKEDVKNVAALVIKTNADVGNLP